MNQKENRIFIFVSIIDHFNGVEETFPYSKFTNYRIIIETKYKKWTVDRRYKQFEELHNQMKMKISPLPKFPEKRFFSRNSNTIRERKELFSQYINYILAKINFISNNFITEFLGIDKELIAILLKCPTAICRNPLNKSSTIQDCSRARKSRSHIHKDNLYSSFNRSEIKPKIENESNHIDELLINLENNKENICQIVNEWWKLMKRKKKWESLKREDIYKLLFGNNVLKNNGLLNHCGSINKNVLGAEACLDLVAKLIDYETNPDCENCIFFLKMSTILQIQKMNLDMHLMSNKPLVITNSFKILKALVSNEKGFKIDEILKDRNKIDIFNNFLSID